MQCHGTFDLIHPGHIVHFEEARALGDALVVTITGEKFVNKGPGRPYFNDQLRSRWLAALECVDHVVVVPHAAAVEAILAMRPEIGDWRNVKAIDIHTFDAAVDIIGKDPEKYRPKTRETADHSMPYCVAVALIEGDVGLQSFDDAHLANEDLIGLTNKVKLHRDAACNAGYPLGIPNRLTVHLNDGRQLVKEVVYPRGHSGNPMTDAEVEKKFRTVVEPKYGAERAGKILKACWELEQLRDAGELVKLLG